MTFYVEPCRDPRSNGGECVRFLATDDVDYSCRNICRYDAIDVKEAVDTATEEEYGVEVQEQVPNKEVGRDKQ